MECSYRDYVNVLVQKYNLEKKQFGITTSYREYRFPNLSINDYVMSHDSESYLVSKSKIMLAGKICLDNAGEIIAKGYTFYDLSNEKKEIEIQLKKLQKEYLSCKEELKLMNIKEMF